MYMTIKVIQIYQNFVTLSFLMTMTLLLFMGNYRLLILWVIHVPMNMLHVQSNEPSYIVMHQTNYRQIYIKMILQILTILKHCPYK